MKHIYIILFLLLSSIYSLDYDRKYFKHWSDKNCQDTRVEVLIEENLNQFRNLRYSSDSCKILRGLWFDPYSGTYISDPSKLDVDHVVPLFNAWISGADKWSPEKRELYANYIDDKNHLIAVSYKENRSKGAKAPHEWMPTNTFFHIEYCKIWCEIKVKWCLTVTMEELEFLKKILKNEKNITYPQIRY